MRQRLGLAIGVVTAFAAVAWLGGSRLGSPRVPPLPAAPSPTRADAPPSRPQPSARGGQLPSTLLAFSDAATEADPRPARSAPSHTLRDDTRASAERDRGRASAGGISPAELDAAPAEVIEAALHRAVAEAQAARPLAIAPAIIELVAEEGRVRVIFETRPGEEVARLSRTLDSGGRARSVEDLRVFPLLDRGAAMLSPGALLNLIRETPTGQIELDGLHTPSLLSSVPQIGADVAHENDEDGDGFAVAVIDTGVDGDHPMLASRLIEEACFSVGGNCPNDSSVMLGAGAAAPCTLDQCDHGTHVAGIAVGDAAPNPLVGVAPHAQLIAINVFSNVDGKAAAFTSDILAAMQHVLALAAFHDVAAVNLSLGGDAYTSEEACDAASPSMLSAVAQLRNAGIATVAAAGNDGFTNAVSSPACLSDIIAVGSVSDTDGVSSFSNSADFLTLLAPGETILSAAVGGGTRSASGTSMATPHVAGAIAAIREAAPEATVAEIENALVLSGEPIADARNGITKPRVQVDQTIDTLLAASSGSAGGSSSSTSGSGGAGGGGGGGGGCGLIGIEPFLVLPLVRIGRSALRRGSRSPA